MRPGSRFSCNVSTSDHSSWLFTRGGLQQTMRGKVQIDVSHLPLVIATLAVLLTVSGCSLSANQEAPTPTPLPTAVAALQPTHVVMRGPIVEETSLSGRVAAVQEEQLFFRTDGRVAKLNIKERDRVKQGDVLAELEISDLLNQLAQAQVTLDTAELKLKNATAVSIDERTRAEIAVNVATARLAQAKNNDPAPAVAIAAANRDKAAASVRSAQAAFDAGGQRKDSAAALGLERATLDAEIADAQYQQALQAQRSWTYDLVVLEQNLRLAELNLTKIINVPVDPTLAQDVAKSRLAVERLNAQVASGRLVAPFDGEIASVSAAPGRTVTAYRAVAVIVAPGSLEISVDVPNTVLPRLAVGQEALISLLQSPGQPFKGAIRRLPSSAGSGATGTVQSDDTSTRIAIKDMPASLSIGASVQVSIVLQQKDNVLWLPPAAVRSFQGRYFVLVLDGVVQSRLPVRTGITTEDKVEIVSGLDEGQVVIEP